MTENEISEGDRKNQETTREKIAVEAESMIGTTIMDALDDMDGLPENGMERPRTKPDSKTKGQLLHWQNSNYAVFVPQKKKEQPSRTVLNASKTGVYFKNEGEKQSSYSLRVSCSGDELDPAAALLSEAQKTLKGQMKQEPKMAVNRKLIHETENLQVWRNEKERELKVFISVPSAGGRGEISRHVMEQFKELYKVIMLKIK